MRHNRKSKVLSLLLVFVMLVSYLPVTIWAVESATDIQAIEKPTGIAIVEDYDDYVGENWVSELGLPQSVKITLANGTKTDALVTWDTTQIDTRTTGYYSVPGTVMVPAGSTNSKNLKASITVQVRDAVNLISNGDFNNGVSGWKGWALSGVKDPLDASNSVLLAKRSAMVTSAGGNQALFQGNADAINALVKAFQDAGFGQYYIAIDAMSAPYDASKPALMTTEAWIHMIASTSGSSSGFVNAAISSKVQLSTTEWKTISALVNLDTAYNWMRTDIKAKAATTDAGAIYLDNFRLFALKMPLEAEPAAIASVKTEILARSVVLNYPEYVGKNWQEQLGLPKKVEVLTDNGDVAELEVKWNYSEVDFSKYGKYVLTGTFADAGFPNPSNVTVQQTIYVGKAQNMIPNGGFEADISDWYVRGVNPKAQRIQNPVVEGKYALLTGKLVTERTTDNIAYTRNTDVIGANIGAIGAGQYYFSLWGMSDSDTLIEGLYLQTRMLYKTVDENGVQSSATTKIAPNAVMNNKNFVQSAAVVDVPNNVNWARLDMYCVAKSAADMMAALMIVDYAQIIPLNVTIPKGQEPADVEEILTEIPARAVIKDYDKYVGADWKSALALPETVKVRTATGNVASVGVTWDFEPLNIHAVDKYTLVGTLDTSAYPNPKNLYATQIIHIREYKNLLPNGNFEGSLEGWNIRGANPNATCVTDNVFNGGYAALSGAMVSERTSEAVAHADKMADQIGINIAKQGAGQYYYSAWMQSASKTLIEGLTFQSRFLFKTVDEAGVLSASNTKLADSVALNNKNYLQSAGLVELPANVGWARIDLYITAKTAKDLCAAPVYIDFAEILPLNIVVEQYEGEMAQVESIIPARNIVQNYPDYVGKGYTTADLLFPETVMVRSTSGELVEIGVNWKYEMLDLTKTGTYKVVGVLEDMRLPNPKGLTVEQSVKVVSYQNLLNNGSFEDYGDNWRVANQVSSELGIMSPVKDGNLSLLMKVGRLEDYTRTWIQSLFLEDVSPLGLRITGAGAGRYYFGGWVHGTKSSSDMTFYTRLWYRYYDNGDVSVNTTAPMVNISENGWVSSGAVVDLPGDIYWSRLDLYVDGGVAAMKNAELYIDHMQLIPLNVEAPSMTDIINCEPVADVFAHVGSAAEELDLPETLQIIIKSGQKFDIPVKWDLSKFDTNRIGQQTITGELELGGRFKNTKNYVPSTVVTLRAKGEDLRQTIYIANDGSEDNDGLSPENPKKEITKIPTYLKQGYNVRLKKGDIWYIETASLTFKSIYGTQKAPLTITSYGEGEKPIIGFMRLIEDSQWKLVDEKRNVWAADVTSFGIKEGESVHRCFVRDEAYFHLSRSNYVTLEDKEFCSYNNTLYIRMPAGEKPEHVEITPFGSGADRIKIQDVSYLTFEDIHIKGASSIFPVIRMDAPTKYVKFTHCDLTHVWYYTILLEADDERVHYKPEFSYLYIDTFLSEKQGAISGYYSKFWNPHGNEGITMRDGVDGAWIHHNYIHQVSHGFVAIESIDKAEEYKTTGVYNCIIEDNVLAGGNALYARAFNICGGRNLAGNQMCHDNIHRRNKCYDMTVSSHLYGEHNLIYSNLISYSHTTYNEDGTLFDGKSAQPWGFDTIPWSDHGSVGNMVINNTFYDVAGAVAVWDQAETVYNNLYANNLVVNWKSDPNSAHQITGAFYDNTVGFNYYMHNGLYDLGGDLDHFVVNDMMYSAYDVNNAISGYKGNLYGDPLFENVDLTLLGKGVRQDFTLSGESPFRYAGLSFYDPVFKTFRGWERLVADPTDINGVVYLAESPSIGAWSFSELITGDVAEVGKLESILSRPGASIEQLQLPDSVPAVNDKGIDVVLLVDWNVDGFDSSKPGVITLTGNLRNGPHTDLKINGKIATIDINIKDKLELMSIVTELQTLNVLFGTSYEDAIAQLPTSLHVVEESGFEEDLPVSWSCMNYKPGVPGDYTFKCVLPVDMLTNAREFPLDVTVRQMHELGRGVELLVNSDFIEGSSAAPWKLGWLSGNPGTFRVTEDPSLLPEGEPGGAIVTVGRKYASIQQDVTGQIQLLGDGKYLFVVKMRAYDITEPIDSSYACLQLLAPITAVHRTRPKNNIGTDYVEFRQIMDLRDVMDAQSITFHTSTGKSRYDAEDGPRSYVIAGCSLVYLGKTDAEAEATLDSIELNWNAIRGENGFDYQVTSKLNLPTTFGTASTVKWTSSDESAISADGTVRMGYAPKTVTLTANITYKGQEIVKKFTVTVPRNPDLHTFSGAVTGDQTVDIGDEVNVILSAASATAESYNAYRFTLSFNADKLEFVGVSDSSATVQVNGGQLIISGIGTEKPIGDTMTITFKALKSGLTEVKLVKVEMDSNPDATMDELPPMSIDANSALIDVLKAPAPVQDDPSAAAPGDGTVWIIIAVAAVLLLAAGAVVLIILKKKKQTPTE